MFALTVSIVWFALVMSTAENPQPISSLYTGFDSCVSSCSDCDGDVPQRCKGVGEYSVYEGYSAMQTFRTVEASEGFEIDLSAQVRCDAWTFGPKIEWRMAGDAPFAVIHRVYCYRGAPGRNGSVITPKNLVGEYLLVRGLAGYESLVIDIDVRADKKANESARAAADNFYTAHGARQ